MRPQKTSVKNGTERGPPAKMEGFRNWPTTETSVSDQKVLLEVCSDRAVGDRDLFGQRGKRTTVA